MFAVFASEQLIRRHSVFNDMNAARPTVKNKTVDVCISGIYEEFDCVMPASW